MTTRSLRLCLLAMPLLLASCINQGQIDTLNARVTQNEQRMHQLSSQVGNVEQVLPGQAEMWAQMQAMRQELNLVRGQMDEMTAGGGAGYMAQMAAHVGRLDAAVRMMAAQMGIQVDALLDAPAGGEGMESGPGTPGGQGTAAVAPVTPVPPVTPVQPGTQPGTQQSASGQKDTATLLYDSGMSAFASRNYKGALKAFSDFTKTYPSNNLTSSAQFWVGESYYKLENWAEAVFAYQKVITDFPGSAKFQSAMLKQGMALHYAGKKDAAKVRLNELIKRYPSSAQAGMAKKFMEQNK